MIWLFCTFVSTVQLPEAAEPALLRAGRDSGTSVPQPRPCLCLLNFPPSVWYDGLLLSVFLTLGLTESKLLIWGQKCKRRERETRKEAGNRE